MGLRVLWCAPVIALAATAWAQSPTVDGAPAMLSSGGAAAPAASFAQGEIVREIDDPHTGERWLLMRDDRVPGGPGRLVRIAIQRNTAAIGSETAAIQAQRASETHQVLQQPAIRAGDRLIVEEHTAVADGVLQARALSPAFLGSTFNVRLTIGGKVMRAVALGPGRAALQPETGVRP